MDDLEMLVNEMWRRNAANGFIVPEDDPEDEEVLDCEVWNGHEWVSMAEDNAAVDQVSDSLDEDDDEARLAKWFASAEASETGESFDEDKWWDSFAPAQPKVRVSRDFTGIEGLEHVGKNHPRRKQHA